MTKHMDLKNSTTSSATKPATKLDTSMSSKLAEPVKPSPDLVALVTAWKNATPDTRAKFAKAAMAAPTPPSSSGWKPVVLDEITGDLMVELPPVHRGKFPNHLRFNTEIMDLVRDTLTKEPTITALRLVLAIVEQFPTASTNIVRTALWKAQYDQNLTADDHALAKLAYDHFNHVTNGFRLARYHGALVSAVRVFEGNQQSSEAAE
ncbi:hypothetical protein [Rhodoblastus sp.]|jgi:hypothetical protein|uniref:hypothetical protein n=1 Tax=Rhodoblastus sp. TaxID=1962975 RepID=UPI0025E80DA1|nr:hypothetical protein [Rhodoblastus sp.]